MLVIRGNICMEREKHKFKSSEVKRWKECALALKVYIYIYIQQSCVVMYT